MDLLVWALKLFVVIFILISIALVAYDWGRMYQCEKQRREREAQMKARRLRYKELEHRAATYQIVDFNSDENI